ncbi:restriction endonuclease fold toxin-2 domain-containing protein [Actinacidiphila paucisporea]|uniref:Restriction endonuclease fold toxin 2 n=1 Tax=Actinacidiphila paucisporea TaxID=310782 RepID=A0A1M7PNE2_9ACTN|nr:restriction endonuclease fold toxin-2 domain-containing protein [Actinacidiphila paucisporea]SHN18724.1 Restriction endonuclease fold toxin 2 [Actinacidiphila paucisporea]
MGLPPDLQVVADAMMGASMEMVTTVMPGARDTAIAVFHELDRQKGMAGGDDAGHDFAKVYTSAAAETLDQMGYSAYVMGASGRALMRSAREFIAQEDATAALFMGRQPDPTTSMGDPAEDCEESFLGLGEDLPEVVGETAFSDQYLGTGASGGRFRGSPDKLRDVAGTWERAGTLMQRFLVDAQGCGHTADKAHSGLAADAFRAHFTAFIGFDPPPTLAQQDETLVANLVAACDQLAQACLQYAAHIEQALQTIRQDQLNPFHSESPLHSPLFGGNGDDGGLKDAIREDPWIHALGDVAHALDTSRSRVKLPHDDGPHHHWYDLPGLPLIPVPIPEPVPLVLAAYPGAAPGLLPAAYRDPNATIPWAPPIPPAAGTTTPLSPAQRQEFITWVDGLRPVDFGGARNPGNPDNAYQLRVAGYPERVIPLSGVPWPAIAADGMRPSDGYMVDAKYVRNEQNCYRRPSTFEIEQEYRADGTPKWNPDTFAVPDDRKELQKYKAAIAQHQQIRGLEIDTNFSESQAYWQTLMEEEGVTGVARYVP